MKPIFAILIYLSTVNAFLNKKLSYIRAVENHRALSTRSFRAEVPLRAIIELSDESNGNEYTSSDTSILSEREREVMEVLSGVIDPVSADSLVAAGLVKDVKLRTSSSDNREMMDVKVVLKCVEEGGGVSTFKDELKNLCILEMSMLEWIDNIRVEFENGTGQSSSGSDKNNNSKSANDDVETVHEIPLGMKHVKRVVAVSSCKGGVGKSTTSVNLAYTLKAKGFKVGILDADIYGPSLPTMTSPSSADLVSDAVTGMLLPLKCESGVRLMSMGWINKGAAIMRGPMVNQILNQFVSLCDWGEIDYLIIDMPPGTGDIQLTLAQVINVDAAVIVTTPQRLSFVDVVKGIDLFDTVNIPCVAVVENMSELEGYAFSPDFFSTLATKAITESKREVPAEDVHRSIENLLREAVEAQKKPARIFGRGHTERMRKMWGIESVISLPVVESLSRAGDTGKPFVLDNPESVVAEEMRRLADSVISEIDNLAKQEQIINFDSQRNLIQYTGKLSTRGRAKGELDDIDISITPFDLRCDCRCALCVEEMSGKRLLDVLSVDPAVKPIAMAPIGRYAMSVSWSDGHKSLYPFKQIAALAEMFDKVDPR